MWGSCVFSQRLEAFFSEENLYLHGMLQASQVSSPDELRDILSLQQLYLRGHNSLEEEAEQGFLTISHSFDQLEHMHHQEPSVIVKDGGVIAGYALVMSRASQDIIPVLVPMFQLFDTLSFMGTPLTEYRFYVMGQICVRKSYRGQGVFELLYQKHKELYQDFYSFVITEISTRNLRSLRAHYRVGFRTLDVFRDQTDEWNVALWDWDAKAPITPGH